MIGPRAAISFSAGKDSCLALQRARAQGLQVEVALTMFEEQGKLSRSHGLPQALLEAQASALGLELITAAASWADYEVVFIQQLQALRARGISQMVFGDIDLQPHRDWEEKVCAAAGLQAVLPLWHAPRAALARAVIDQGFKCVVVCVNTRLLAQSFVGRDYDDAFLRDLPPSVDACGENGEFHTFVHAGPGFAKAVPFTRLAQQEFVAPAQYGGDRFVFQRIGLAETSATP
jgi:uncharacterized protein (TIGR00290 family)